MISTVETAFTIVEAIGERGNARAADLSRALSLTRANVHRLLYTLEELGYVEKDEYARYHLTFSLFELGNTVPHSRKLIDTARPSMLGIAQLTGETVNNGVLFEGEVLYIDKVEATAHLKLDREIGSTDPAHCTSLGKVLLAYQEEREREAILRKLPFEKRTDNTITDPIRLEEELNKVVEWGYAVDFQELSYELNCVAAPVFDENGRICTAISISGPSDRFTRDKIEGIVEELKATTEKISSALIKK